MQPQFPPMERGHSERNVGGHNAHVPVHIVTPNEEFHVGPRYPPREEGFDDYVSRMHRHPSSQ